MSRWLVCLLVCVSTVGHGGAVAKPAESQSFVAWEQSNEGETAFVPMESAPYPHPSREKGFVYNKALITPIARLGCSFRAVIGGRPR